MEFYSMATPAGRYLYDRSVNKLMPIDEDDYNVLERYHADIAAAQDESRMEYFRSIGLCRNTLESIEHPQTQELELLLDSQLSNVVLQVTQNCNLRCDYCAYSGKYCNRKHDAKRMSEAVAFAAVDFAVKHSKGMEELLVGFYGGEPFLEFKLIQKIIAYIKMNYPEKKVQYNLTTNATLFTEEILDYVKEKNIRMLLSIDGPESIQNRNRIFVDGKGSFKCVTENIMRLKSSCPTIYENCRTNTVLPPNGDYGEIEKFFLEEPSVSTLESQFSMISDSGIKESVVYSESFFVYQTEEKLKSFLEMAGKLPQGTSEGFLKDHKRALQLTYDKMKVGGVVSDKAHPGGPCVPGTKRLFIDINGNFYPCEKISEQAQMQIGSIYSGYRINKINEMMNIAKLTENECKNCWAFLFCTGCIVGAIQGETSTNMEYGKRQGG